MSNKLHEILALEHDRKNSANLSIGETIKRFNKNSTSFDGMVKKYIALEEDAEQIPDESKEMVSTVKDTILSAMQPVIVAIDATLSKEETNSSGIAKAELKVDDVSFGEISATSLLALETHLNKILTVYKAIPTLDTTIKWHLDDKNDYYRTNSEVKFRTIKRPKVIVKYEATEKHPAQTEILNLDFQVGKYETTYFSGRLTPNQKNLLVEKVEKLIEAVKIARAKANNVDVKKCTIAKNIFDYIHKDILK